MLQLFIAFPLVKIFKYEWKFEDRWIPWMHWDNRNLCCLWIYTTSLELFLNLDSYDGWYMLPSVWWFQNESVIICEHMIDVSLVMNDVECSLHILQFSATPKSQQSITMIHTPLPILFAAYQHESPAKTCSSRCTSSLPGIDFCSLFQKSNNLPQKIKWSWRNNIY